MAKTDLDAGACQTGDGVRHPNLQLVFDGGGAHERELHLQLLRRFVQLVVPVVHRQTRLPRPRPPTPNSVNIAS